MPVACPLLAAISLCWLSASSLWIYPHSLSYFNESIGGPLNGPEHLLGSNLDCGQDLRYLDKWLKQHPQAIPRRAWLRLPFSLQVLEICNAVPKSTLTTNGAGQSKINILETPACEGDLVSLGRSCRVSRYAIALLASPHQAGLQLLATPKNGVCFIPVTYGIVRLAYERGPFVHRISRSPRE